MGKIHGISGGRQLKDSIQWYEIVVIRCEDGAHAHAGSLWIMKEDELAIIGNYHGFSGCSVALLKSQLLLPRSLKEDAAMRRADRRHEGQDATLILNPPFLTVSS